MRVQLTGVLQLACVALALSVISPGKVSAQSDNSSIAPATTSDSGQVTSADSIPDSPSAVRTMASANQAGEKTGVAQSDSPQNNNSSQTTTLQQTQNSSSSKRTSQQPAGTAAAEAPNVSGIAASQPAGVAIAPAKQHRVRTIVLKTGALIGAGVAIGTVVALTAATPSKPPGAR